MVAREHQREAKPMIRSRCLRYGGIALGCVLIGATGIALGQRVKVTTAASPRWPYPVALNQPLMNRVRQQVERRTALPDPIPTGMPSTAYDGISVHRWLIQGTVSPTAVNLTWYGVAAHGSDQIQIAGSNAALAKLVPISPGLGSVVWWLSESRNRQLLATPWKIALKASDHHSWRLTFGTTASYPVPGTTVARTIAGQHVYQTDTGGISELWYAHGWLIVAFPEEGSVLRAVIAARTAARYLPTIARGAGMIVVDPGYQVGQYATWVRGSILSEVDDTVSALATVALIRDLPPSRY